MKRRKRFLALLLIGLVVIASTAAYIEFHFHLPQGAGPAGPTVALEAFAKPWTERRVLLLGLGDSVTAGFGAKPGR